jgi:hypothetical protein
MNIMGNIYKTIVLFFLIVLLNFDAEAQVAYGYYNDALKLSQTTFGGSARFQALGGATSALGADIGSLSSNPAGLGMYNRSDMNISLGYGLNHSTSNYMGSTEKASKGFFNIPSGGMIFSGSKSDTVHKWKGGTFGIGVTSINNFQNKFKYSGINTHNNFTDYLVEQTNGIKTNTLDLMDITKLQDLSSLAYYTFLVNPVSTTNSNNTEYNSFITGDTVKQEEVVTSKGRQYQYDIAYAANINDRLYIGASMGIVTVKNTTKRDFTETSVPTDTLISYTFTDERVLKGTGVNVKIGMIYRVSNWLRLGGSVLTPTTFSLKETRKYRIESHFIDLSNPGTPGNPNPYANIGKVDSTRANPDPYRYNLNTPFKFSGGMAIFIGKKGFISADLSYLNYNMTKLSASTGKSLEGDKNQINNFYRSTFNYNIGGEYRKDIYRLRGGFAYYGNPYKQGEINGSIKNICLGVGVRYESHYFDITYVHTLSKTNYKPYNLKEGSEPSVSVKNSNSRIIATFGLLF